MKLRAQEHTKYTNHYSLLNKKENKRKQKKTKNVRESKETRAARFRLK